MVYQDIWSKKLTEDTKCMPLHKVSIFGISKEIDIINTSDTMAVVATMMEPIPDIKLKSKTDTEAKYRAYDALIFYVVKKPIVPQEDNVVKTNEEIKAEQPQIPIPTVDLGF